MSYRFDTLAIHAGQPDHDGTGAVTVPVYQTSTFRQIEPGVTTGFGYARTDHPTRRALEDNLAALEGAKYGLAFASGMEQLQPRQHERRGISRHSQPAQHACRSANHQECRW